MLLHAHPVPTTLSLLQITVMSTAGSMLPILFPRLSTAASQRAASLAAGRCCASSQPRTGTMSATSTASFSTSHLIRAPPTPPLSADVHATMTHRTTAREPPPSSTSAWSNTPRSQYPPPSQHAGPAPPPPNHTLSSGLRAVQVERDSVSEACATLSPSSPSAPRSQRPSPAMSTGGSEDSVALASGASSNVSSAERRANSAAEEQGSIAEAISEVPPTSSPAPQKKASRNFRSQKAAITLTQSAVERLQTLLDSPSGPRLIRIGVRNKGCAGMSYHLEYVEPSAAGKFDEKVKQDGVEVLVDSKALFSIIGSEMDWKEDRLSAKFVFNNPNIKEACGCGESFLT